MTRPIARSAAAAAVADSPWRVVLSSLVAAVPVASLTDAARVAQVAVAACGTDADAHLSVDVRPDVVTLELIDRARRRLDERDVELAAALTDAVRDAGLVLSPPGEAAGVPRAAEQFEISIDAMDASAVLPFWRAVLGYTDLAEGSEAGGLEVFDPLGRHPTIWFQQMDEPRPQRNRIHFDVSVDELEAPRRIAAALAAGGRLVSDRKAKAFWILADPEGNEVCVCTWQDRD